MKIISVIQQKGGAGKTTLSVHLAYELAARFPKKQVAIADADPQQSAAKWINRGESANDVTATTVAEDGQGKSLKAEIDAIDADLVILDLPPAVGSISLRAALYADLMLVPVGPSVLDLEAAQEAVNVCQEAIELDPKKKCLLVPTRLRGGTSASKEIRDALAAWGTVSKASVGLRQAYADAAALGKGVSSFAPKSAARKEIKALSNQVVKLLGGSI